MSILAALGLCGGPRASKVLARTIESGRSPELRVFAALASARENVRVSPKLLARLAGDAKAERVERAAARFAMLCRGYGRELRRLLSATKSHDEHDGFWVALGRALDPVAAPRALGVLRASSAPRGAWRKLERRALILDAAVHPGLLDAAALRAMLGARDEPRLRVCASLALGRLGLREGFATDPIDQLQTMPELDRSGFVAGLQSLTPALQEFLLRGPGLTRDAEHRQRFRAATIRLVSPSALADILADLLEIDAREARPALEALLRRVLIDRVAVALSEGDEDRLLRAHGDLGALLVFTVSQNFGANEGGVSDKLPKLESARLAKAVALLKRGRYGTSSDDGARLLWRLYVEEKRSGEFEAAGSTAEFVRQEFARLLRDYFVAGASPASPRAFVPDGIRRARTVYFEVLSQHLLEWPLPLRLPRVER